MKQFLFDERKQTKAEEKDLLLLVDSLLRADSKDKMQNLLLGLMTTKEIEEFAERIRIVQLLKKGVGQHDVAAKLGTGVATVSRGAKEIKEGKFKTI